MEFNGRFEVTVPGEPMSGAKGKRKLEREAKFIKEIERIKKAELPSARQAFKDKPVVVSVIFNLPKLEVGKSNTRGKKDLDNMLKLVLDSLQPKVDAQGEHDGLNLISSDERVYRVEAVKHIVDRPEHTSTSILITEFKTKEK